MYACQVHRKEGLFRHSSLWKAPERLLGGPVTEASEVLTRRGRRGGRGGVAWRRTEGGWEGRGRGESRGRVLSPYIYRGVMEWVRRWETMGGGRGGARGEKKTKETVTKRWGKKADSERERKKQKD